MTEWKTYRLGDVISIKSGFAYKGEYLGKGDKYLLGMGCVSFNEKFLPSGARLYSGNVPSRYFVKAGDIVLATRQQSDNLPILGMPAIIPSTYKNTFVGANLYAVQNDSDIDNNYLYWLLKTPEYIQHIKSCQTGTTVRMITKSNIESFEFKCPNRIERNRISNFLWSLENKIECNRGINTNLESQAQALYKQWFVDNLSDDWEEKPLSEIADFIGGYSYKRNELVDSSTTAMATIKNFERKGGFKVEGFKDISASSKLKADQHANLFDILVAHTDLTQNADVIGNAEILLTCGEYYDIIFSMDLVKVLPRENFPYKFLLAAMLKNPYFKAHCLGYVNGTTVLHMSKKALPEYVVACPSNEEAEKMDNAFKAYYQKMAEILQENTTLATLRDTLLPKLMNGEIKL